MTTTKNYDEARAYSTGIAGEVRALEQLLTTNDPDEVAAALAELGLDHVEQYDALSTYLAETALEITYYHTAADKDGYAKTRVVILRTCGGPFCEITRDSYDGHQIEITTYLGSDSYTYRATAPALAEQLDELAKVMAS